MSKRSIIVSAPGKIHLLGEHSVVYGKPAIIASVDLRVRISIIPNSHVIPARFAKRAKEGIQLYSRLKKAIEPIIKRKLKLKKLPPYQMNIESQLPIGSGLGSSASLSAAYIAALLTFLKIKWDLKLVNKLTFEAEKAFHGNPSGGDNSTVVFGGLIWFRKEDPELKLIQPLNFTIPPKLARNFLLINTGKPKESTLDMVNNVKDLYQKRPKVVERFLNDQEKLVKELLSALKTADPASMIQIIKAGERNLESIGVVSSLVKSIIRRIEKTGGAAKICGAGGKTHSTGILLCYHKNKKVVERLAKSYNLPHFSAKLGVEGVKLES